MIAFALLASAERSNRRLAEIAEAAARSPPSNCEDPLRRGRDAAYGQVAPWVRRFALWRSWTTCRLARTQTGSAADGWNWSRASIGRPRLDGRGQGTQVARRTTQHSGSASRLFGA